MGRALGEPALVLCSVCINHEERRDHLMPLSCGDDQALLGNYSVRVCHGCRVNTLQRYLINCDVWLILKANKHAVGVDGVEMRVKTSSTSAGVSKRSIKSSRKISQLRRKSGRFIKQQQEIADAEGKLGNPVRTGNRLKQVFEECEAERRDYECDENAETEDEEEPEVQIARVEREKMELQELFKSNQYLLRQELE
ncbi:hypothetical protein PsorP6_008517 [Peronosclerospora sorghi]|uniref:Uncharacterized protein n=1 Tax=Peronosclerospora sorghi TaxID=230839 RepID=A0ACC0W8H3_9STRA|nr:hypothetical protein PsorP6_008517 [Peronosclerospora sorghi]